MEKREEAPRRKRFGANLSASDRLLETLWGLLIVLSVTGSAEVWIGATSYQVFAIGLVAGSAWAAVEAVMELLRRRLERARQGRIIARAAQSLPGAETELTEAMRDSPVQHLAPEDRAQIRAAILEAAKRAPPPDLRLRRKDIVSSLETGLALWSATLPVVVPFVLIADPRAALAVSEAIAVAVLFAVGAAWGRYTRQNPLRTGTIMALVGLGLAGLLQFLNA